MIGLVLDDARREIRAALQLDALAVAVERAHLDLARPRHAAADVGDAQAAFPVLDDVAADRRDLGIDDRHRLAARLARSSSPASSAATNSRSALVHLRRRQPDAVVLVHRLEHVVDQLLDRRRS